MKKIDFFDKKIALLAEGNSERYYVNMLLDAEKLLFNREQLVVGNILPQKYRNGKKLENEILSMQFEDELMLLLVQDNSNQPKISSMYAQKIDETVMVITTPEIEMLLIHHLGYYHDYARLKTVKKEKPSKYIAEKIGVRPSKVKSKEYIQKVFTADTLMIAIKKYSLNSAHRFKGTFELVDLLK